MITITKEQQVQYTLTLDQKTALWLKDLLQNPISIPCSVGSTGESETDTELREALWNALNAAWKR